MAAETQPFKAAYPAAPVPEVDSQIARTHMQTDACTHICRTGGLFAEGDVFPLLVFSYRRALTETKLPRGPNHGFSFFFPVCYYLCCLLLQGSWKVYKTQSYH